MKINAKLDGVNVGLAAPPFPWVARPFMVFGASLSHKGARAPAQPGLVHGNLPLRHGMLCLKRYCQDAPGLRTRRDRLSFVRSHKLFVPSLAGCSALPAPEFDHVYELHLCEGQCSLMGRMTPGTNMCAAPFVLHHAFPEGVRRSRHAPAAGMCCLIRRGGRRGPRGVQREGAVHRGGGGVAGPLPGALRGRGHPAGPRASTSSWCAPLSIGRMMPR